MHDPRFAWQPHQPGNANIIRAPFPSGARSPRERYLKDWSLVRRARFNAAKRCERKQAASTLAFAIAGVVGFLVPVYTLLFDDALSHHAKSVLDFTAFVIGALSLVLGLIEQAKDYPARARRFDLCGRRVNSVLRRLTIAPALEDEDLSPLIAEYERALEECEHNHDEIDHEVAVLQEELALAPAPELRRRAITRLRRLRWSERVHTYGLYVSAWIGPLLIGILIWLFLPPPG
jgi:hypothetical protein